MDASYDFLHVSSTFFHVFRQKNKKKILEKITPGQGHDGKAWHELNWFLIGKK